MAIGLLTATGLIAPEQSGRYLFIGELSLDGRIKAGRGLLPVAAAAER
jgi:magnesium chelatase family protein